MNLDYHPMCLVAPRMQDDEFRQLVKSMREDGFDDTYPIVIHDGMILDGRHRYEAALEAGIQPTFVEWVATGNDTPEKFALRSNIRRHMTTSQRAAYVVAMTKDDATLDDMASEAGVSRATIAKARRIAREDPDIMPAIIQGDVTIEEALRDDPQPQWREDAPFDDNVVEPDDWKPPAPKEPKEKKPVDPIDRILSMTDEFSILVSMLNEVGKRIDELVAIDAGAWVKAASIKTDLKNAKDSIRWAKPYKRCPYENHDGCKTCKGKGWVIKDVWDNIPEEDRK